MGCVREDQKKIGVIWAFARYKCRKSSSGTFGRSGADFLAIYTLRCITFSPDLAGGRGDNPPSYENPGQEGH